MEWLQGLLQSIEFPLLSALILGLMTAISPCPLATNITAIAFISKDITDKKKIFLNGLIYALGRIVGYAGLASIIYFGASKFQVSKLFNTYGERLLGPILIIIGILMLDIIHLRIGKGNFIQNIAQKLNVNNKFTAFFIGLLFSMAFCPYSGVLYFGMLIPLTLSSAEGLLLPIVFAIATALPVIIIAYLLAFTVSKISGFYNKIKIFEIWVRRIAAILFILTGIYFVITFYF